MTKFGFFFFFLFLVAQSSSARSNNHHTSSHQHHTSSHRHHTPPHQHHNPSQQHYTPPQPHYTPPQQYYTPPEPNYAPPPPVYTPPLPLEEHIKSSPPVQLRHIRSSRGHYVVIDNGIVSVKFSTPKGVITEIQFNGVRNLLASNSESNRGYWDTVWGRMQDKLMGTKFKVIEQNEDYVELSFSRTWQFNSPGLPVNTDKRFIMLRGIHGFYTYAIFDRPEGWPDVNLSQARMVFKLNERLFDYMAVSKDRQKFMPSATDRKRGQVLDYPEAVHLTNPRNPALRGEVDDKYQFSCDNKDKCVHGWISSDLNVGFWVISPSNEYRSGGPTKQELTSHAGPTSLAAFFSGHYAGDMGLKLENGEAFNKVFGPVFIYLNSASSPETQRSSPETQRSSLWEDANKQMSIQTKKWPYDFPLSKDLATPEERATVSGRLLVYDWDSAYAGDASPVNGKSAYVGLAPPGDYGSWQRETKGYQFWNTTDDEGIFLLRGVRPGNYTLFSWVPGFIGEYKHAYNVIIKECDKINMGNIHYEPLRNGPTLWEIGIPDRSAAEFFIPDPRPSLMTHLHLTDSDSDKFRQYGMWERYTDLYPTNDLVFDVVKNNPKTDWFYAHVQRYVNNTFVPTTWEVHFDIPYVIRGYYTLRIALASATGARLEAWFNSPIPTQNHLRTGLIGRDNAIARHGAHGMYWLYEHTFPGYELQNGKNILFLRQFGPPGKFMGVMYDYIRLEGPFIP